MSFIRSRRGKRQWSFYICDKSAPYSPKKPNYVFTDIRIPARYTEKSPQYRAAARAAEKEMERYDKSRLQPRIRARRLSDFQDDYFLDYRKSKGTRMMDKMVLERLIEYMGDIPLKSLRPEVVRKYKKHQLSKWAQNTVAKNFRHLRSIFAEAVGVELDRNPFTGEVPAVHETTALAYSRAQLDKIEEKALKDGPYEFYALLLFYRYYGKRATEAIEIHRDQVDLEAGRIYVLRKKRKNNPLQVLEIGARVRPSIEEMLNRHPDSEYLYCRPDGKPWSRWAVYKLVAGMLKEFKISGVKPLHSFRHAVGTDLAEAGVDPKIAAEIMGVSQEVMHRFYVHLRPGEMEKVLGRRG